MIWPRSARASATIRAASLRPSFTTASRSSTTRCESLNAESTAVDSSSMSASTSPRLITADADIGIERASSTTRRSSASFTCTSTLVLSPARPAGYDDTTSSRTSPVAYRLQPFGQPRQHMLRHQLGDIASEGGDLLHEAGGKEGVRRAGRHEHRLDVREAGVHLRHLQLVVEVADRAQTLHDRGHVVLLAEVREQP